jgi:hypothetical protein
LFKSLTACRRTAPRYEDQSGKFDARFGTP